MFQKLELFQMSYAMARHAGQRQALVAQNMANADTPGYRPQDMVAFSDLARRRDGLVATRAGHIQTQDDASAVISAPFSRGALSPNGNAVSVEDELLRAVDVKRQHDRAITIYRHSMTILRASLGRQ